MIVSEIESYNYCEQAIKLKQHAEVTFIALAGHLMKIRDEKLWNAGYTSFEEFLDELKISPATASKLISIYQKYVIEYGFTDEELSAAGGWSVLAETLPLIGSRSLAEEWLVKSATLSLRDIRKEALEAKKGIITTSTTTTCEHHNKMLIEKCIDCGHISYTIIK